MNPRALTSLLALSLGACASEPPARRPDPPVLASVAPPASHRPLDPPPAASASATAPRPTATPTAWRALSPDERRAKALEAGVAFETDGTSAYWFSNDHLLARPLAGGPARIVKTPARPRSPFAIVSGAVLLEGSLGQGSAFQAYLVPLDGGPPRDGGARGLSYARFGEELWVAGLDAIWRFDAPDRKVKHRDNHEAFTLDADAFFFRDQARNVVRLDRKGGSPRVLATDAWSDVALDGDDVLFIKPDPEAPDATAVPSHRTIERAPKKGGKPIALASAEEPCGLWLVDEGVFFFAQGPTYGTTALYRAPRARAGQAEKVADTPTVGTFFGCRDAARLVGRTLYWASGAGWLFRADLSVPHPAIEVLVPEPEG